MLPGTEQRYSVFRSFSFWVPLSSAMQLKRGVFSFVVLVLVLVVVVVVVVADVVVNVWLMREGG